MSCAIAKQRTKSPMMAHLPWLFTQLSACVWGDGGQWKRREEKWKKQRTCKEQIHFFNIDKL